MKDSDAFSSRELFPIDKSEYLDNSDGRFLLYSPLAGEIFEFSREEIEDLERQLEKNGRFDDAELQKKLLDSRKTPSKNHVSSPDEVYAMTVLPNNICNFSCSYCYASKGHGHDELSDDTLKTVVNFFVNASRIKERKDLFISFGGGGEPMISWPKVKNVIEYSHNLAEKQHLTIHYSYASNGSIINGEIIETVKKYNIKTNISFDILKDIQNIQRKYYNKVCQTLDLMLENNITPTINSVITPLNVERQCEMVEEIHNRFPGLKRLSFDYVVDGQLFNDSEKLKQFYQKYTDNFYKAQQLGKSYGISVSSIKYHNLELLKSRACAGGFDLTPNGTLSMCFFVSSPEEPLYNEFVYGEVRDGKVSFDSGKFKKLIEDSSNERANCRHCFVRWHCGGGCLYHANSYSKGQLDIMCDFQRRFSLIGLLKKKR